MCCMRCISSVGQPSNNQVTVFALPPLLQTPLPCADDLNMLKTLFLNGETAMLSRTVLINVKSKYVKNKPDLGKS